MIDLIYFLLIGLVADAFADIGTFDQLAELIQTYEGFQFDLRIVEASDELR